MRWFDSDPPSESSASPGVDAGSLVPSATGAFDRSLVVSEGGARGTDAPIAPQGDPAATPLDPSMLGPLAHFMTDEVTDLMVNAGEVWTDSPTGLRRETQAERLDEHTTRELAARLVAAGGRHLDHASPCVDAPLPGGGRVHAVIPPVASDGTAISLRFPRTRTLSLERLCAEGAMSAEVAERLTALVVSRANVLVTGSAGAGKTTLLAALMGLVPADERIVTVEDVRELRIDHPHVVALEARQANTEGVGELGLDRLVREALRMRPDRLILGEVRGVEVRDMLLALGSGHDGGGATLHARSLDEVGTRLEMLGGLVGLDAATLARMVECAIDAVVHVERVDGVRRVAGLGRPVRDLDRVRVEPFDRPAVW